MKPPRFILAGSLAAALFSSLVTLPLAAAPATEDVLIDFTDVRRERDGTTVKNYEWASGDWDKHIVDLPRRGCLIQSATGKGNLGENRTMVKFDKSSIVKMVFVIGNANNAKAINLVLEDSDGTEQSWAISFEGLEKGQEYHFPLDLATCTKENKPGKKPGMNLKKITNWNINGGWTEPNLEVLLIKLVAPKA